MSNGPIGGEARLTTFYTSEEFGRAVMRFELDVGPLYFPGDTESLLALLTTLYNGFKNSGLTTVGILESLEKAINEVKVRSSHERLTGE